MKQVRQHLAFSAARSALAILALAIAGGVSVAQPAGDARCAGIERSVAAGVECVPLQASDFPVLFAVPVELADHQFNPDAAPAWISARRGRPLFDRLDQAENFEVLVAATPTRAPMTLEFTSTPFAAAADQDPLTPREPVRRLVMRFNGNVESVQGWYVFAANNDEAIAWAMDRDAGNSSRMQYQEGRVDMGTQLGFGRDMAGFQMAVFLGEYEINTRHGSSGNDMIGFTLSRRR